MKLQWSVNPDADPVEHTAHGASFTYTVLVLLDGATLTAKGLDSAYQFNCRNMAAAQKLAHAIEETTV